MGKGGGPNSQRRGGGRGRGRGGGRDEGRRNRGRGRATRAGGRGNSSPQQVTTTTAAANAYAEFLANQRQALTHWKAHQEKKRHTMQKVSMSGDSQDMVADLLHEITGTDAEEVLFSAEEQMNDLGVALQHSAEAKFLLRALLEMRFRRDHAQQACAFVFAEHAGSLAGKDTLLISALDWLCLHVDDKHLPRQFASVSRIEVVNSGQPKSSVAATVALAEEGNNSGGGHAPNVATVQAAADLSAVEQQQIFRLMSFGFSRKKITEALREQAQDREMADEDETLGLLLAGILQRRRGAKAAAADKERQAELEAFVPSREELAEMWEEEQEALAGIFDDDFAKVGRSRCEIVLRCTLGEAAAGHAATPPADGSATIGDIVAEEQEVRMVVVVPADSKYPAEPPLVGFLCSTLLPKTCLEVTKRLLGEAAIRVRTNLEEYEAPAPVLWELSSWLEEELPRILELVMPGKILFGDDEPEPEPEPEPEFRGLKTKYERSRERAEKEKEAERHAQRERMERIMALGEQIVLDKAGPQFTYEVCWESDKSVSQVRPNEVAARMRPDGPLGNFADRGLMPGLEEYDLDTVVRCKYDSDWLKATIVKKTKVVEEAPCSEVEEDPDVKRLREQEAVAAAQRLAEAEELKRMQDEEETRLAESRLVAHKKAIARSKQIREEMNRRSSRAPTLAESQQILAQFRQQQQTPAYKKWQQVRAKLPAAKKRAELLELMASSQALVVSGETGCGKTTQVPQFLLDDMIESERGAACYIICTQPRRISAVSVAERVADERGEKIGQSVGYQIRLESKKSASTRLLFCTTGILLRRLQGDSKLEGVSHIVVDEIHERSIDSDFLLIILKELMVTRPDIKIVLMSATLNAELFSGYFTTPKGPSPAIHIPGFTHPVTEHFLEDCLEMTGYVIDPTGDYAKEGAADERHAGGGGGVAVRGIGGHSTRGKISQGEYSAEEAAKLQLKSFKTEERLRKLYDGYSETTVSSLQIVDETVINNELIEALIVHIAAPENADEFPEGAILVFLPGLMEITNLFDQLSSNQRDLPRDRFRILPLHSTLSTQEQQRVFEKMPPNVRKVVLSTNIAETSVTIDDVVFVIDCGRHKENRFDPINRMPQLMETWVSRANSRQRRGRAGRVRPGHAFFLFTRERSKNMAEYQTPEMLRVPLDELCLQIKLLDLGDVADFLGRAIEPPRVEAVTEAIKGLQDLQALDLREYLTPLGYHLASLPVNVRIGKILLYGTIFRCIDPTLTIAAGLSFRSPFVAPFEKREEADKARKAFAVGRSDHLTLLKAFDGWVAAKARGAERQYCMTHYLSANAMRMIAQSKRQFVDLLLEIGFLQAGKDVYVDHKASVGRGARDGRGGGPRGAGGRGQRRGGHSNQTSFGGVWYNANSHHLPLVKAVLCAGLYPNIVRVMPEPPPRPSRDGKPKRPKPPKLKNREDGEVFIHPISANFDVSITFPSPWLMYFEKVKTTKVYVRDCTMVTPYPLLLFGGEIVVKHELMTICMDDWIEFRSPGKVAVLIKQLRAEMDKLLVEKIDQPAMDFSDSVSEKTLATIVQLIVDEEGNGS